MFLHPTSATLRATINNQMHAHSPLINDHLFILCVL